MKKNPGPPPRPRASRFGPRRQTFLIDVVDVDENGHDLLISYTYRDGTTEVHTYRQKKNAAPAIGTGTALLLLPVGELPMHIFPFDLAKCVAGAQAAAKERGLTLDLDQRLSRALARLLNEMSPTKTGDIS